MEINTDRVLSDIGRGYINTTALAIHFIGGAATAFLVNKITQKLFDDEDSIGAKAAKIFAFAVGTATSFYAVPYSLFSKYTYDSASYLLALIVPAFGTYPLIGMVAGQHGNHRTLIVLGTIGAAMGASINL